MTQTGGGCRASNYIHLLRKALKKDGLDYIPVISLNLSGLESNSGFQITLPLLRQGHCRPDLRRPADALKKPDQAL